MSDERTELVATAIDDALDLSDGLKEEMRVGGDFDHAARAAIAALDQADAVSEAVTPADATALAEALDDDGLSGMWKARALRAERAIETLEHYCDPVVFEPDGSDAPIRDAPADEDAEWLRTFIVPKLGPQLPETFQHLERIANRLSARGDQSPDTAPSEIVTEEMTQAGVEAAFPYWNYDTLLRGAYAAIYLAMRAARHDQSPDGCE